MSGHSWRPEFRSPASTLTRVLGSAAFRHARARSADVVQSPEALRALADKVETLDRAREPLATVADLLCAAVRLVRASADRLDGHPAPSVAVPVGPPSRHRAPGAVVAARERLVVASLDYLVTPDDLVPDFRPGGYLDDVLLITWVFGAAAHELEPHLDEPSGADG